MEVEEKTRSKGRSQAEKVGRIKYTLQLIKSIERDISARTWLCDKGMIFPLQPGPLSQNCSDSLHSQKEFASETFRARNGHFLAVEFPVLNWRLAGWLEDCFTSLIKDGSPR